MRTHAQALGSFYSKVEGVEDAINADVKVRPRGHRMRRMRVVVAT
jgi:hypothetical protein